MTEKPVIPKVRRWADGSIMHDYVFENEPDEATVERFANMSSEKRQDMRRRMRRIIDDDDDDDDDDALVGFEDPE